MNTQENELPRIRSVKRCVITPSMLILTALGISDVSVPFYFGASDKLKISGVAALSIAKNGIGRAIRNNRPYIHLFNVWATGYYHWLLEVAPKFYLFESEIRKSVVLIPRDTPKFITEFLQLFEFAETRIVDTCLYMSDVMVVTNPKAGEHDRKFVVPFRDWVKKALNIGNTKPFRKVYVSRRLAARRKVINDLQVSEILAAKGFETHYLETLSFSDQVQLFSECKVLVTIHGAGIANSLFMPAGGRVLELFPQPTNAEDQINHCFSNLATTVGLNHEFLFCSRKSDSRTFNFHLDDIQVDLSSLNLSIQDIDLG